MARDELAGKTVRPTGYVGQAWPNGPLALPGEEVVTLPDSMWAAIGEYRFYNRIPTEAEAIRQLIQKGLDFPRYLEPKLATIEILTGRTTLYPGPFSAAGRDLFAVQELLADELQRAAPSLGADRASRAAEAIFMKAMAEAGSDIDRACSLLNVDWRRFAE